MIGSRDSLIAIAEDDARLAAATPLRCSIDADAIATASEVDDAIVSDKLISLILAQISENPHLEDVFAELFRAAGSELYLRPAGDYLRLGSESNFATVVDAARRRGEVAIGFRLAEAADDPARDYGIRVNPPKSEALTPTGRDRVVVLAES